MPLPNPFETFFFFPRWKCGIPLDPNILKNTKTLISGKYKCKKYAKGSASAHSTGVQHFRAYLSKTASLLEYDGIWGGMFGPACMWSASAYVHREAAHTGILRDGRTHADVMLLELTPQPSMELKNIFSPTGSSVEEQLMTSESGGRGSVGSKYTPLAGVFLWGNGTKPHGITCYVGSAAQHTLGVIHK